jgi:hypothetical protein
MGKARARLVEARSEWFYDRSSPEVWRITDARGRAIRRDGALLRRDARQRDEHLALPRRVARDTRDPAGGPGAGGVFRERG